MTHHSNTETLEVQGFTPYAQIPRWVLRSGKDLSHGAVRLYGVIMSYADNETSAAFPGRERLAEDLGVKVRAISGYVKELEEYGALIVTRRRNKRTGNFYANHYVLVFNSPGAQKRTRRDAQNDTVTRPTNLTTPSSLASKQSSDDLVSAHSHERARYQGPGELPLETWNLLLAQIQNIGTLRAYGHDFYSDTVQDQWAHLESNLEERLAHLPMHDEFMHQVLNQGAWTIDAPQANYESAKGKLRAMISAAIYG